MTQSPEVAPPRVSPFQWALRGFLLIGCVASIAWIATRGGDSLAPPSEIAADAVVTLAAGDRYGQAVRWIGPAEEGQRADEDAEFRSALKQALGSGQRVLVRVSPGVYQRHIHATERLIREAGGDGVQVIIHLSS